MDKIRVLVTDDHMLVRQGLCRVLEGESDLECVAIGEDGKRAIELAKEYQPNVAVIDVSMPNIDGIEAIKTIKKDSPNTAVLVVSAYKYERYVSACLDAGAYTGGASMEYLKSKDCVLKDREGMMCAENLGKRVAEMTRIVKAGISALENELPSDYFSKRAGTECWLYRWDYWPPDRWTHLGRHREP